VLGGGWIATALMSGNQDTSSKLIVALILVVGFGLAMAAVFEVLAAKFQHKIRLNLAQTVNAVLGALFSVCATLIVVWLLLASLNRLPLAETGMSIAESGSFRVLSKVMPPAPNLLGKLNQIITPYGFPQIFVGGEPMAAPTTEPVPADVEMAAAKARQSVVRIEGAACGDISSGSGFVAAPGFVATNAHVLAGVTTPIVVSSSGKFRAVPVWFNDRLDFAVLRVEGLGAPVLPLAENAPDLGQTGAILGYPGGGPLTVVPGVMRSRYQAVGRDIYGQNLVTREIYQLQAAIHHGNSGGPFVLPDGSVAGVVFGASPEQPATSYAIASTEIAGGLQQAVTDNTEVATGNCL
jgi:S1-C subfamily serine protease